VDNQRQNQAQRKGRRAAGDFNPGSLLSSRGSAVPKGFGAKK
jgi:hypothetical protein